MLLLVLACTAPDAPPAANAPTARLAARTVTVSEKAADIAARAADLEGKFDELREAPMEERGERLAQIRAQAQAITELAEEAEAEVKAIEASGQVY